MEKKIYGDAAETVRALADHLVSLISRKEGIVTMALSGGSTPAALFRLLADEYGGIVPWERVRLFWVDERCVPPDHEESNFGMTRRALLNRVPIPEANVFRILGENDPSGEAMRYSDLLDRETESAGGKPAFDIILLGMGDDGHTASIFPDQISLFDSPENCVAAAHPRTGQRRISLSGSVINNGRAVLFLITGTGKRDVLEKVLRRDGRFPASLVEPREGELCFYLDSDAAG